MNTESIKVENLKCNGCASTIKKGLLKFDEIKTVNIDIEGSVIEVNFEGDMKNIDNFKHKLAKLGYPELGHNSSISVAKSYFSCAVGKFGESEE